MKYFLLLLLLLVPSVLAIPVEDVLQTEPQSLSIGELYLFEPTETSTGQVTISSVFLVDGDVDFTVSLFKDDVALDFSLTSGDTATNETYSQVEWSDLIVSDTTYSLVVFSDGEEIYRKDILVNFILAPIGETSKTIEVEEFDISTGLEDRLYNLVSDNLDINRKTYDRMRENGRNFFSIKKVIESSEKSYSDGSVSGFRETILFVSNGGGSDATWNVYLVEEIPKDVANTVDDLDFSSEPIVLEYDPVVMWHLEDLNNSEEIIYYANSSSQATGNTIILAERVNGSIDTKILAPIILIPLIAALVIYFSRFKKS